MLKRSHVKNNKNMIKNFSIIHVELFSRTYFVRWYPTRNESHYNKEETLFLFLLKAKHQFV